MKRRTCRFLPNIFPPNSKSGTILSKEVFALRKTLLFTASLLALNCCLHAQEQWSNPYTGGKFNNIVSSYLDTVIVTNIQKKMLDESLLETPRTPEEGNYAATSFQPQTELLIWSGINQDGMSIEQRNQLQELYGGLLKNFDDSLVADGDEQRRNNVATAFLYLLFSSHYIRTRQELTQKQQDIFFERFYVMLSADPAFLASDNARKQMMYEALVTTAGLMLVLDQQGSDARDPEILSNARTLAEDSWKLLFGDAANEYSIGTDGIVVKTR
jgi:hypothetical protein